MNYATWDDIIHLAFRFQLVWLVVIMCTIGAFLWRECPRWIAFALVPFALASICELAIAVHIGTPDDRYGADEDRRTHALEAPLRIGNAVLPAGLEVTSPWAAEPYEVHAGKRVIIVRGIAITGTFEIDSAGPEEFVQLAHDQNIGGFPCSSEDMLVFTDGVVECTLSARIRTAGITFEPSATVKQALDGRGTRDFGPGFRPPSIRVFGQGLSSAATIAINHDTIVISDTYVKGPANCRVSDVVYDRAKRIVLPSTSCPAIRTQDVRFGP